MTVPRDPAREKELPPSERVLLSEATAAELCSVSLPTFRKWTKLGLIDRVPLPGDLRRNLYRRADVVALADRLVQHS